MPRKFSTQVALSDGLGVYSFGPGDEVPEWAANKVGEHVLESAGDPVPEDDDEPETVEEIVAEEQGSPAPVSTDGPDFTKPAPIKRGPGRPRKN